MLNIVSLTFCFDCPGRNIGISDTGFVEVEDYVFTTLQLCHHKRKEALGGLEPPVSCLANKRIRHLSYSAINWSGKRDSNPRHSRWQRDALPTELLPHKITLTLEPYARQQLI
jgi:hypothetical protein